MNLKFRKYKKIVPKRFLITVMSLVVLVISFNINNREIFADNESYREDYEDDYYGNDDYDDEDYEDDYYSDDNYRENVEKRYVIDDANLLTDSEMEILEAKCKVLSDECEVDLAIASTNDALGKSTKEYAQDCVLDNNLGYEDDDRFDKSAVLFLVDLDNMETYIVTEGLGILLVEDGDIENILDDIYEYIGSGRYDYYNAYDTFLDSVSETIIRNYNDYGKDYEEEWETFTGTYAEFDKEYVNVEKSAFYVFKSPVICLAIALLVAGVAVAVMSYSNKAKMTATGDTYMDRNEFRIYLRDDRYIKTTTTKVRIDTDSGSGGGGGSHGGSHSRGSGGHSFGGGGRKL